MRIKNITYQNVYNGAKAVLRGKFIASSVYIRKEEKSKINKVSALGNQKKRSNLSLIQAHTKKKKRKKEIINIRIQITEHFKKENSRQNQQNQNLFLEKDQQN